METSTLRKRTTRHSTDQRVILSARDIELFRLLDRYRYLPSNFLHAFVGGNVIHHKTRLTALFHEGWLDRPYRQWAAMNARYRPAIYELGDKAKTALADRGLLSQDRVGHGSSFAHELMVCLTMASFELAAKREGIRFSSWKEVLRNAPEQTQNAESPFVIPVTVDWEGKRQDVSLRPDGRPFTLTARRTLCFPGIEVDRHTEPLDVYDLERSSILKKILAYRVMAGDELFKSHFGFSNMLVPIVTVNERHMENMMELVKKVTGGRGLKFLLFRCVPDFISLEKTIEPDSSFITGDWLRAGFEPVNLGKELALEPR